MVLTPVQLVEVLLWRGTDKVVGTKFIVLIVLVIEYKTSLFRVMLADDLVYGGVRAGN